MATTYTRLQLRDFQTSSVDLTAKSHTFTLVNNNNSTAYFAMEGARYWDGVKFVYKTLFPSASISTLVNCTVVSGSTNAAFIIDPNATATFAFTPTATIAKEQMQFSAPNAQIFSTGDATASGSLLGVDLNLDDGIYVFANKTELQTGVNLWISDNTAALATYGEINTWNVSAITNMDQLFQNKTTFNSDISNWDVSNVTTMRNMFDGATSFDQPIGSWNMSSVNATWSMFRGATSFNQPLNNWDMSSVQGMLSMFANADSFQQPLNLWEMNALQNDFSQGFMGTTGDADAITYTGYDALLIGWAANASIKTGITISFGDSTFTAAALTARNILTDPIASGGKNWTITDGGQV